MKENEKDLLAKIEKESPDLTREGFVIGSAPYMSPEQARGEKVDGRSDIFSLGVVMYEAFTGQRAFTADNKRDMILDRQNLANLPNKQPIPMRNIDSHIPDLNLLHYYLGFLGDTSGDVTSCQSKRHRRRGFDP